MEEERITLLDENGEEVEFDMIATFDIGDKTYTLLSPDEDSDDVYPFRVSEDEEGEVLIPIEDEEELAEIEEVYIQLCEEEDMDNDEDETE